MVPCLAAWRRGYYWRAAAILQAFPMQKHFLGRKYFILMNIALNSSPPYSATNVRQWILIKIQNFSFMKMHFKISPGQWQPFCPVEDELKLFLCWSKWQQIGIGLCNGFVPISKQTLPKPLMTQIYDAIWRHWATMSYIKQTTQRNRYSYHIHTKTCTKIVAIYRHVDEDCAYL